MATTELMFTAIDETEFIMDYLATKLPDYKLNELTNGHIPTNVAIHEAHPLSIEFGNILASGEGDYTSLLPAIGVELIPDTESQQQVLGRGSLHGFKVTQAWIDALTAIPIRDRIKTGTPITDSQLTQIQTDLDAAIADDQDLWGKKIRDLHQQQITVSIWASDITAKKLLYKAVRACLKRMRFVVSALGVKAMTVSGTDGFYNYDFSDTLFGAELSIGWIQPVIEITIDSTVKTIEDIEIFLRNVPENASLAGLKTVAIGEASEEE